MTCQKKNKKSLAYCLLLLLCLVVVTPLLLSVNSYASETTTQTVDQYFREHNFYETCAYVCRKYASFPYNDYLTGSSSGIIYDNFADYLESIGKSDLLQEDVIITGTGGGRGYDIPQDVRQEMLNFVQEVYIDQNPLSYTQCTIRSYNNTNASAFPNYAMYTSFKEFCKSQDGYILVNARVGGGSINGLFLCVIPKNKDLGFIGGVNSGVFSNVQLAINWVTTNSPWNYGATRYLMEGNGTISTNNWGGLTANTVLNTSAINTGSGQSMVIYSNLSKDEIVYVFPTLASYKNYNSSNGAPYYLPSNSQSIVPYYDGFTQSDLNSAGNFYNNIVINTENASPNDIRKTTDNVLGSLDGLFGGSDSESDSGGGLLGGLADIITGATGAISPIKEIVLGDIKALIEDTFSWLPPTIITIWIAGISFGVFFGVLKLIRG